MINYDWSKWSDWQPLQELDLKSVPTGPGVYVFATGKPLTRAIGQDPEGILDIGESVGIRQRLRDFIRCATNYGQEGHMAGWRYARFRFNCFFSFDTIRVRWRVAASKKEAYELEGRMMFMYIANHCELPPLNYSFNMKPFEIDGWDLFDRIIDYKS